MGEWQENVHLHGKDSRRRLWWRLWRYVGSGAGSILRNNLQLKLLEHYHLLSRA